MRCLLAVLLLLGTINVHAQTQDVAAGAQLKALLDEDLDASRRRTPLRPRCAESPGTATCCRTCRSPSSSREHARERSALERLKAIDAKAFHGQDRISYELLLDKMEIAVEAQKFTDAEALVLSTLGGLQTFLPRAAQVTPFKTAEDYRDYVKRIRAMPKLVDDTIERLKPGLSSGWMSPKPVLDRVVAAIDAHLVDNVEASALLRRSRVWLTASRRRSAPPSSRKPGAQWPTTTSRRCGASRCSSPRVSAEGAGRGGVGLVSRRRALLRFLIRSRIIRGKSAQEIHALGLAEVERLRAEIGAIAKEVGFKGTTDEFIEQPAHRPKYFFESADAVLAAYRAMPARVDPQLPKLFHNVPRMRYAVRAMTPAEAASSTAANYQVGSLKLGTSGYFTINALGYASEAKWRVETLFLHEAVPGHHMQVARAAEIEGLHPWRSQANFNIAYGEGWALYAEGSATTWGSTRIRTSATATFRRSSSAPRASSSTPAFTPTTGRATRRSPT